MLKMSIPIILGAFLLGTSSEALVITCPATYNANNVTLNGNQFTFQHNDDYNSTFADRSSITVKKATGEIRATCFYKNTKGHENFTLSFKSKLNCWVPGYEPGGVLKQQQASNCDGHPGCATITCE